MSIVPAPTQGDGGGPLGGQISDVVGLILDKGLVIDVFVRVSLVGIEILTIDARVVVASVDTYLRFAEKAGRLNIEESTKKPGLPDVLSGVTGGQGLGGLLTGTANDASKAIGDVVGAVGGGSPAREKELAGRKESAPLRRRSHPRDEEGER
jgi:gas vesicle structural protein